MNGGGGAGMGYGAAANFVGGLMQAIAASQEAKEMGREFNRELRRQGKFQGQAFSTLGEALPKMGVETARTQLGTAKTHRQQDYAGLYDTPLSLGPNLFPGTDRGYYDLIGGQRANLGSYGDWQQEQGIASGRLGQNLGQISNFARGISSVFPYRMQDAQHSWDELAFWGGLISSVGGSSPQWSQMFGGTPQGTPVVPSGGGGGYNPYNIG